MSTHNRQPVLPPPLTRSYLTRLHHLVKVEAQRNAEIVLLMHTSASEREKERERDSSISPISSKNAPSAPNICNSFSEPEIQTKGLRGWPGLC